MIGNEGEKEIYPLEFSDLAFNRNQKGAYCGMDNFPRNPPNPPLSKGGQGGFLELVANLGLTSSLSLGA
jgi:hypothetical protein